MKRRIFDECRHFSAYRATFNELKQKTDINLKKVDKWSITADVEKNDRIREGKNPNSRPQQLQASRKLMMKEDTYYAY